MGGKYIREISFHIDKVMVHGSSSFISSRPCVSLGEIHDRHPVVKHSVLHQLPALSLLLPAQTPGMVGNLKGKNNGKHLMLKYFLNFISLTTA